MSNTGIHSHGTWVIHALHSHGTWVIIILLNSINFFWRIGKFEHAKGLASKWKGSLSLTHNIWQ